VSRAQLFDRCQPGVNDGAPRDVLALDGAVCCFKHGLVGLVVPLWRV
jgi:hypothetical protein